MGAPVKFLFEDDFTAGNDRRAKPTVPLAQHEAALAQAQADAYRNGMLAAEAKIEARAANACDRIAQGLTTLAQSLQAIEARLEAEHALLILRVRERTERQAGDADELWLAVPRAVDRWALAGV